MGAWLGGERGSAAVSRTTAMASRQRSARVLGGHPGCSIRIRCVDTIVQVRCVLPVVAPQEPAELFGHNEVYWRPPRPMPTRIDSNRDFARDVLLQRASVIASVGNQR